MTQETYRKVKNILGMILVANLAAAVTKIVIGSLVRSTSVTADGFHSLTDGLSNVIGIIGIRLASKPVDEDHPYGHHKFETLSGLFIGGMLLVIGAKILQDAVSRFISPVTPSISAESLVMLLGTLALNIFVCLYEYKKGRMLGSQILISDSMHTRSDIYVSIGVIVTLLGIKAGLPVIIDPIVSLVVSGFILYAGIGIFKSTSGILVDRAVLDTDKIREIALSFEQVKDAHDIRSRGSQNDMHIDMHIMTEPLMSVKDSHDLIHAIERKIREELQENTQVIVHLEPYPEKTFGIRVL